MTQTNKVPSADLFDLTTQLKEKRELKSELDTQSKALGKEIEGLDRQLSTAMALAECPNFSHGGSTFYLNSRLYASPKEGMKDEMINRLEENGFGSLVTQTVNANTLASFCRDMREENQTDKLPAWLDDVVNTYDKVTVGIRKGK